MRELFFVRHGERIGEYSDSVIEEFVNHREHVIFCFLHVRNDENNFKIIFNNFEKKDFIKNSHEYLNWIANETNHIHDPSLSTRGSECAFLLGQHLVKNEFVFCKKEHLKNDCAVSEKIIPSEISKHPNQMQYDNSTLLSVWKDHHTNSNNGSTSVRGNNLFGKPLKKIIIFSSPYRRCLETVLAMLNGIQSYLCSDSIVYELYIEYGVMEWFGEKKEWSNEILPPTLDVLLSKEQFRTLFSNAKNQSGFASSFYTTSFDNHYFKYFLDEKPIESVQDLEERCKIAMDNILKFVAHENEDESMVMVVTHAASLIKAVEALLPPENRFGVKAGTCGLSQLVRPAVLDEWQLKINSDASFLDGGQMYYWDFGDYEMFLRSVQQNRQYTNV